jgi:hypothetical protein
VLDSGARRSPACPTTAPDGKAKVAGAGAAVLVTVVPEHAVGESFVGDRGRVM